MILVTGARGYLGRRVVQFLDPQGVGVIGHGREDGDLTSDDAFQRVSSHAITGVVHCAAATSFTVDRETARAVNVEGTARALELAARCPRLTSFTFVSTVYATGLRSGALTDEVAPVEQFANWYEWSKHEAEQLVSASGLPWAIARVATVIADDTTGAVTQFNAFHNTLRLFFYGLLSVMPGDPRTPVHLVTGDGAAAALADLACTSASRGVHHIADPAVTLGRLVDLAFAAFADEEAFRARRLPPPLFADEETFALLRDGLDSAGGDVVRQAVESVSPFARQLFVNKSLPESRLQRLPMDTEALVAATCRWLARTRWGRRHAA